jgi:putative oxidoreductase
MHADHSIAEIIAHAMIAFLFLYRGLTALPNFADHLSRFQRLKVPLPRLMLLGGFVTMLIGGVMVLFDYRAAIGAGLLIVFTLLANLLYHHFWAMDDPRLRQTHTWIFCNNIAVMGGLLMVIAA